LIGDWFIYWGGEGPMVPEEFGSVVQKTQGHKSIDSVELINSFVSWASGSGAESAVLGDPFEWLYLKK
jgi:hypothetical protein